MAVPARYAFHAELAAAAIERMRLFSGLVLLVHVPLLLRDLTLDASAMSPVERRWQWWLFLLHALITVAALASLAALRARCSTRARVRAAYLMTATLLVWLVQTHELGPKLERELKGKGRVAVRSLLGRRPASAS